MDKGRSCPIDNQIQKIITSSKSREDLINALCFLNTIATSLLSSSSETKCKTLEKSNPILSKNLLNIEGVYELLFIIGYRDDGEVLIHGACDVNMKILEAASRYLNMYLRQYNAEGSGKEPGQKEKEVSISSVPIQNNENVFEKLCKKKEKGPCKLKEFLMKHLNKENTTGSASNKYQCRKNCSSGYSFNSEGYFYQNCKEREAARKKDPRRELFDSDEHDRRKRCPLFSFIKTK